ncbi:MAG: hypothetical protein UV20_C0019G0011 [Candidatus Magasanikbacteria bacterium GW2011_GWA2_42_32]|uniref:Uncharacterized protein n=1 Tax=Candidatus Magasanikbacteria bacterium GW2011_GWA2_42_32 TaxID=1619039 RepID=A0A0G1A4P8_9BACT|nr:MAG: hypothetical protein UV20_C0019G0011 [Candidatus Magasanikbacteria bacterium GW2011_GWA2_42_32]OGI99495.1 MAG: hypothetical protein A3H56_03185 [Candidatus Nomurabacteria bacterium RIFCSPLOWO2_02_FULL_42_24]
MFDMLKGESLKRLLQGLAAGVALTLVLGFGFGGWQLQSRAEKRSAENVDKAVVVALAPICADKFQKAADAPATLVKLKAADSWKQDDFITEGGWATFPGSKPRRAVAEACANLLTNPPVTTPAKSASK